MPERRIGYPGGLFALLWKEGKTIEQQKNRFTDAEMEIAKETDLPDLLESLGYQVRRVGSYHTTKEMDSLRIKNRRTWFRYSEGVGGDAITILLSVLAFGRHRLLRGGGIPRPAMVVKQIFHRLREALAAEPLEEGDGVSTDAL